MNLAIDEIYRSRKYHIRQLEENLQEIRNKEEVISFLKTSNEKHIQIIEQLSQAMELIKMDMDLSPSIPVEKQPTNSIEEMNENDNLPR